MINVNLLPHHLRPIKRTPLPYMVSFIVVVIALAVMATTFLEKYAEIRTARNTLQEHKDRLASLKPIVDEHNQLVEQKQALAKKIETINEIVSDRIIWSRQLWNLARLIPRNFWYDGIGVEMKRFQETVTSYNPDTKEDETKQISVMRQLFVVGGHIIPGEKGSADLSPFLLTAEKDEEFASLFELETSSFEDAEFEGFPVRTFELEYLVSPKRNGK